LARLNIHLFDPQQATSQRFSEAGIPCKRLTTLEAFSGLKDALIIIGEGVSLRARRGITDILFSPAAAGNTVLCLAAAPGVLQLPASSMDLIRAAKGVHLCRGNILQTMDKRLDGAFWSEVGGKAGGVHSIDLQARNRRLFAEVAGTEGWPWLELRYPPPKARFIYCGFTLLEGWDQGP
jgi:hypothetical protein